MISPGIARGGGDVALQSPQSGNVATAVLEYQETGYSFVNWGVSIASQSVPFKKEPVSAPGKTIRGVLRFGNDPSNSIPFIWQRDAGKLFLDLNRNQDLADDAAGVFSIGARVTTSYGTFTNVHLPFHTASGNYQVLVDLNFWDYGSQPNCSLAVRSFWQGKVTLQGRDWQVGIVQNVLNRIGSFENGQLLLRPWEKRNKAFSAYGNSPDAFPFTRKLFVDGHAYQLDPITRSQNDTAKPVLHFTEQSVTLGELKINGKFIQRLVLPGGPYLVILDQPAGTVKIPTGSYNQPNIQLEQNGAGAFCDSGQLGKRFSVNDKVPTVLNVGGPLTNSVTASRHRQDLRLDYRLVGAGGETYQLTDQNRAKPPEFAIYKGDKKIATGKFEFG